MTTLFLPESYRRRQQDGGYVDFERPSFVRERGQWRMYGTWFFYNQKSRMSKPCLAITYRFRPLRPDAQRPFVLMMDGMYKFHEGEWDEREVSRIIAKAGWEMGWAIGDSPTDRKAKVDFISLVTNHLDDLKDMPPPPKREKAAVGEMTVKIGDATIEQEVNVDV